MRIPLRTVRPVIMPTDLKEIGRSAEQGTWLGGCENSTLSPMAFEEYRRSASDPSLLFEHWHAHDPALRASLARRYHIDPEQVFITSGAYGALETVSMLCFREGVRVGIRTPDWPGFDHFIEMAGAEAVPIRTFEFPFTLSARELDDRLQEGKADAFIIANPSATQGYEYAVGEIESLLASDPERLGIIDEADSIRPDRSAAHLSMSYDNCLFVGSFSKFYGLSGQRIGYLIAPHRLIEPVRNLIGPCTVSGTAVRCALAALADTAFHLETQQRVEQSLGELQTACDSSPFQIIGFDGCFAAFLAAQAGSPDPYEILKKHGVYLNPAETFGLPKGYGGRINLSDPAKVAAAVTILRHLD